MPALWIRRPPPAFWEVLAALALLVWRFSCYPLAGLWSDWVVILSVYWILAAVVSRSRFWPVVTPAVMTFLFALYAEQHLQMLIDVLRFAL